MNQQHAERLKEQVTATSDSPDIAGFHVAKRTPSRLDSSPKAQPASRYQAPSALDLSSRTRPSAWINPSLHWLRMRGEVLLMFAETQLVEVPAKETALQVYSAANGLDPFLAKIREEIDG
ncbi:TPA: hypothetical protein U8154_005978, partial [Pseudomonas aeruginosa]|nr:hypothetical protein [Pseudomonas aeruginosa]